MPTPKAKLIEIEISCPECGSTFTDGYRPEDLADDSNTDEPLTVECPDCDCEFEQKYTFDATAGTVTLGETEVQEHGDEWTEPTATDDEAGEEDEDDEDDEGEEEDEDEDEDEE